MTRSPASWILLLLALAALSLLPAAATAEGYPRLALYGSMYGDGFPLWDRSGTLQTPVLDEIARYDEVILDASPITPYRPDAIAALRERHPDIVLLAYVLGQAIWPAANTDSLVHYPTRFRRLVRDLDGFLYDRAGNEFPNANVNLAKRDSAGRFVVAEAVADLFVDAILATGLWDGLFVDGFCYSILWCQSPGDSIDFRRAGYASPTEFDLGWRAGNDTLANRLRRRAGPAAVLVGNCAQGVLYEPFNGWMCENFPYQNGGTWFANMYQDPGGYLVDEQRFRAPRHNYIFSAAAPVALPYDANNARRVRFGLGSAALGSGFGVFGPSDRNSRPYAYHEWWYDEYAVDLATGRSSSELRHTGWLGQPLGGPYQIIWVGSEPDAVSNPDFETDLTGWKLWSENGTTATRDTSTAASGRASVRVTIPTPASVDYGVSFTCRGTLDALEGQTYSATFWAKASSPRTLPIASTMADGVGSAGARIPITTEWQRYQLPLVPNRSGPVSLMFQVGGAAGDVWLDDVHFQAGVTSLYRRDFENGSVLVNPWSGALTVPLEHPYRKIRGTVDPVVDDGALVSEATVGPMDALFLIGKDLMPPSTVGNLHPIQ